MPRAEDREREQIEGILDAIAEDDAAAGFAVEVNGHEITVMKLVAGFSVSYEKRPENPHLTLTRSYLDRSGKPLALSDFRARAFQIAVAKARELGWIV